MGKEDFIEGKVDTARHSGRHSTIKRLQGAFDQLAEWKKQRTLAHEGGHRPDEFPFAGQPKTFKDLYPEAQGQELEIFLHPDWEEQDKVVYLPEELNPEIYLYDTNDISRTASTYEKAYPKSISQIWDEQEAELNGKT